MVSSYSTETAMIRTHSTLSTTAIALVHTAVGATDVSGPQSGTWTLAGSPYALVGDVRVPPGQMLTIEPGVEVVAAGHYRITVDQATLHAAGSKTQPILFTATDTVTGKSTVEAMQSGIYWGYVGLIEGLVKRLSDEHGADMTVVATGGLAGLFFEATDCIGHSDPDLTLRGLLAIYRENS